jgi:diguanylate cyclase (GGDEF)-like protein
MRQVRVGYIEILAQLAAMASFPDAERERLDVALATDVDEEREHLTREILERLSVLGVVERSHASDPRPGSDPVERVVYCTADRLTRFIIPAVSAAPPQPLQMLQRPLPAHEAASTTLVEELTALMGSVVSGDNRLLSGPGEAVGRVLDAAKRLLDVEHASYSLAHSSTRASADVEAMLPPIPHAIRTADDAALRESKIVHAPILQRVPGCEGSQYCSAAFVRVGDPTASLSGVLAAWSAEPRHFTPGRLSRLDLLANVAGELLAKSDALAKMVFIDPLTQVHNRTYFHLQIRREIARAKREHTSMVLCILDLDEFKRLNEFPYGYEGANHVLRQVADLLRRQVRPFDCVARWGGEEFVLLLSAPMGEAAAQAICERLRRVVEGMRFTLLGLDGRAHTVQITLSVGAAAYPDDGETADDLWRRANAALLYAKRPPKNAVRFWSGVPAELRDASPGSAPG